MFFSAVKDIVRKADSYSVSFSHVMDYAYGLDIHYMLDCTQAQVDEIVRNSKETGRTGRFFTSNYAVVARISTVKKVRFKLDTDAPDREDYDGPEDVHIEHDLFPPDVFMATGRCLDLLFVGDYKFWED